MKLYSWIDDTTSLVVESDTPPASGAKVRQMLRSPAQPTTTQGAAAAGAGQGPSSTVSGQSNQVPKNQGLDIASKALSFADKTVEFAKSAYSAMETGFKNIDDSGILDPMNAMQDIFGMSNTAYGAMKDATNEFVDSELQKFDKMDKAFLSMKGTLSKNFRHGEFKEAYQNLLVDMSNTNTMALKSFDQTERERALLVQKNLKLTGQEVTGLLQRTYAYTGETSSDILTDIAAHSKQLSSVIGVGQKDLANEMAQILADTETFGNMTVENAGRMAASYKQLGLDLGAVKGIINSFRSFDQAAQKMGDLSAMFGIQMDAMEMMALANEDEEAFLHKMRDDMMDQGVDVENMSKTRLRALGDQLNMSQQQVQTFFRTGEMQADQAEMEAASQKAAAEGVEKTVASVQELNRYVKRTKEEIIALASAKNMAGIRSEFSGMAIEGDKMNIAIAKITPESDTAQKGVATMLSNMKAGIKSFEKDIASDGEGFLGNIMGVTAGDMMGAFKDAAGEQATTGGDAVGNKFGVALGEHLKPTSLPPAWKGLKTGLEWIAANADGDDKDLGKPMKNAASAIGSTFGAGIAAEVEANMKNIGQIITDAIDSAGPLDVDINTRVTAQIAATAATKESTTVSQIDSASLAEQLSGLGLKEASAAILKLPTAIKETLATMTIENQSASQVDAAALTAETLSVENSPAFKALADTLKKMSEDQNKSLKGISSAIKSEKTIEVDLHLGKEKFATAMKKYTFDDGTSFKIHMPK